MYNRKFETRDIGTPDRYLDRTARKKDIAFKSVDYMCRFDQKYAEINGKYDRCARSHPLLLDRPPRSPFEARLTACYPAHVLTSPTVDGNPFT